MTKKHKRLLILLIVVIILLAMAIFVSFSKFTVANPFAVANGLFQIIFSDKQYAEIQAYPKVILAKPGVSLESYMESKGFTENTEKQLGSSRYFEQAELSQCVIQSVNKYFIQWHFYE